MKHPFLICAMLWWTVAAAQAEAIAPAQSSERETVTVTGKQTRNGPADRVTFDPSEGLAGTAMSNEIADEDSPLAFTTIAEGLGGELGKWYEWRGVHSEGSIRPTGAFTSRGLPCRGFTMNLNEKIILGEACKESDGWHIR